MDKIEKLLEVFNLSIGQKQDLGTLLITIRDSDVTYSDVIDYVESLKKQLLVTEIENKKLLKKRDEEWKKVAKRCPDCGFVMSLYDVNNRPGVQVGEGLKSQWFCNKCGYDIYSNKKITEILRERRK